MAMPENMKKEGGFLKKAKPGFGKKKGSMPMRDSSKDCKKS